MAEMPKMTMPQVSRGDSGEGMCSGRPESVELAGTIAPCYHGPCAKILQGKAKWVKFNGARIFCGELTDRNKVFDEVRCD